MRQIYVLFFAIIIGGAIVFGMINSATTPLEIEGDWIYGGATLELNRDGSGIISYSKNGQMIREPLNWSQIGNTNNYRITCNMLSSDIYKLEGNYLISSKITLVKKI